MNNNSKKFVFASGGLEAEVGRLALHANGSVILRAGKNVMLSVASATKEEKDFMGFFPLTVEHRERLAAVGKFPGGFFKREGRLSESEILLSRVIDRSVRPFFPQFYFNEVQLFSSLLAADSSYPSGAQAIIGASLALAVSDIPFGGPVGAVHVYRLNGEWHYNLGAQEAKDATCSIMVVGTESGIAMVEGHADAVSNEELVKVLFDAHEEIKKLVAWQKEIVREVGKEKAAQSNKFDWEAWQGKVRTALDGHDLSALLNLPDKAAFNEKLSEVKNAVLASFESAVESGEVTSSILKFLVDGELKVLLPGHIYNQDVRFDGRKPDQVRPLNSEVSFLPITHGSALFQRGETQTLCTLTLGTGQDAQKYESLEYGDQERTFMLHYNFPPYSVGDVRPVRGVSRREVGHGHLAEVSFKHVLPTNTEFPYTIRSLVDVVSCNGSSSMATVCSTSLALMDAGVPIKEAVAGVAMGLIKAQDGGFKVLTDILGSEDALGLMDLKVTGTRRGIMGVQMDIKDPSGLTREVLIEAFSKAEQARNHILDHMDSVIAAPREKLAESAPQFVVVKIDPSKIGAVIGPSGKVIKQIMADTSVEIDIDDDGTVKIYGRSATMTEQAAQWVRGIVGDIEVGTEFDGTIKRIVDFGLFVELVPGCDGLVHISAIARDKQPTIVKNYKPGDSLKVKVVANDRAAGRIRLVAPALG
jgi:polyribonucleotide nucleotidyltransferase